MRIVMFLSCIFFAVALSSCSHSAKKNSASTYQIEVEKRREEALSVFKKYPDKISPTIQKQILEQKVILGMTPYDCYLAAGIFRYGVQPDLTKWNANSDPMQVMWAQSIQPDNSKIFMIFQNYTQFPDKGLTLFRVDFEMGIAVKILKINPK